MTVIDEFLGLDESRLSASVVAQCGQRCPERALYPGGGPNWDVLVANPVKLRSGPLARTGRACPEICRGVCAASGKTVCDLGPSSCPLRVNPLGTVW